VARLIRLTWSWIFIYTELFCRAIRRCLIRIGLFFLLFCFVLGKVLFCCCILLI
jgi:hypothetical protein